MSTEITAKMVNDLRAQTGAGLMDCKKALVESQGSIEQAVTYLRKKGMASAVKKGDRTAKDGLIESYIHTGGKVGVLLEINCETDFVARTDDFKALARDLCLQIAAASPLFVSRDQADPALVEKEREVAAAQAVGKPPMAQQKIIEGRLEKYFQQVALLDQPFVKDDSKTVKDLITAAVAKLGENIVVRRFTTYRLGE